MDFVEGLPSLGSANACGQALEVRTLHSLEASLLSGLGWAVVHGSNLPPPRYVTSYYL